MYLAREDSFLLLEQVKKHARGKVLDMGTGSAIQALGAADKKIVDSVIAVDVDKKVVSELNKIIKNPKVIINHSDLFSNVHKKFDTIIFNPPYLPRTEEDREIADHALFGGKEGWEIIERFFSQASKHLNEDGIILMVFSSFTGKEKVNQIISEHGFSFKELSQQHIFFEDLYTYIAQRK
jgi:release factor glutamine methyltransferase